ncbi:MAG: TRAP transporter large permease subunit [Rhodospirillales bacterium]|nr:TRAP transporter large permease subunit [Rhodospirillales bacterium]
MEWYWALILMMGGFVFFLILGLPVAFSFMIVNIIGAWIFLGGHAGEMQMVRNAGVAVTTFVLIPILLFVFMGEVLFQTGVAIKAVDAIDRLITKIPGRLSIVAIVSGTIFAALSGSSAANTALLGSTLMPEMRNRGYHPSMAMGPILGAGGLAVLIPPSGLAVLLASLGELSVSDLLIAGIVPGFMMAGMYFAYVIGMCYLKPELAPAYDIEDAPLWERLKPFLIYVVPLFSLFLIVVGSILAGLASPTESAALGALGSIIIALCYRSLNWRNLKIALLETGKTTVLILFIASASITFSQILLFSGATQGLLNIVTVMDLTPSMLVVSMLVVLFFLGCFMDPVSMMLITLPFYIPLAKAAGIDLVWFALLMLIMLEVSFTTPPFGLILFVMKAIAPPDISLKDVCFAALPFVAMALFTVAILFFFPEVALWLPGTLKDP